MRTVRFLDPAGSLRTGKWTDRGIEGTKRTYSLTEVDIRPPVEPNKILGVGRNYRNRYSSPTEYPDQPRIWWKGGSNVVSSHGGVVPIPEGRKVVYGGELGVVIDKECRYVAEEEVSDVVAGYTCVNDISDRSYPDDPLMLRKKSFDNSAPMGPAVVSGDHVPDNPRIQLWVNNEKKQDSAGDGFIYSVSEIVSTLSKYVTLHADDVIMMGSSGDHDPLDDGDRVRIHVEGVGELEHEVRTEPQPL